MQLITGCEFLSNEFGLNYLKISIQLTQGLKKTIDTIMSQLNEQEFFTQIGTESLSIAHLIKHLSGNIKSRWTNFFTEDGEKPWRNRDYEFMIEDQDTMPNLLDRWEAVWDLFFKVLDGMTKDDLNRTIQIRWKDYSVMETIFRHISHVAQHVGQITY